MIISAPKVRQAAPQESERFELETSCPHDFNSVKTSVKNPGSALILSISVLNRLTINRHLEKN